MSNNLTLLDSGNVPDYLRQMDTSNDDLVGGVSGGYPIITYKGKVWTLNEGGSSTMLTSPHDPDAPASYIDVVIIKANPNLSKIYYPNGYEEGTNEKPACYSHDGKTPALDATSPQCGTCAACPHNQWGSRIADNGSKGKACADSRRIAIAAAGDIKRPMLLRIPAGSLKELANYAAKLNTRKVTYSGLVTRIKFDPTAAYPKMLFNEVRWLSGEEFATAAQVATSEAVAQITGAVPAIEHDDTMAKLGPPPAHVTQAAAPAVAAPVAKPAPAKAKPASKPLAVTEEAVTAAVKNPAAAPAPAAKPAAKPSLIDEADSELDAALAMLDD